MISTYWTRSKCIVHSVGLFSCRHESKLRLLLRFSIVPRNPARLSSSTTFPCSPALVVANGNRWITFAFIFGQICDYHTMPPYHQSQLSSWLLRPFLSCMMRWLLADQIVQRNYETSSAAQRLSFAYKSSMVLKASKRNCIPSMLLSIQLQPV